MILAFSLILVQMYVSVIPPSATDHKHRQNNLNLQAVNDSPTAIYGEWLLNVNIGLQQTFQWVFIVADVKQPILSADFLRHYHLLADMAHNRLTDALTQLQVQGITSTKTLPNPTSLVISFSRQSTASCCGIACQTHCYTPHYHHGTTCFSTIPQTTSRTSQSSQAGIWTHASTRHHSSFFQ